MWSISICGNVVDFLLGSLRVVGDAHVGTVIFWGCTVGGHAAPCVVSLPLCRVLRVTCSGACVLPGAWRSVCACVLPLGVTPHVHPMLSV